MFEAERLLHQLARMRAPNIIGSAVFGVIVVLAMWPFTACESDPYADLGDYAGRYVFRRDRHAWPQGPDALCRFRWDTFRLWQEGSYRSEQRNGTPVVILGGVIGCNMDLIRKHGLDDSPTFVFHSSKGDISRCRLRRYNSPISTYDPGLSIAEFRQECWLNNFVSEYGQVTEVWLEEILPRGPIPDRPGSSS